MPNWFQRNLTIDDLWSLLGYLLLVGLNGLMSTSLPLSAVSAAVSGMLVVFWVVNGNVRERTPHPNVRVVVWGAVAAISAVVAASVSR